MTADTLDRTRAPEPDAVRPFAFPSVVRERVGGAGSPELLTARHGDVPLVTVRVLVEAGGAAEPAGQSGVARLTASALQVGTAERDVDELAWELESLGVELETAAGWDGAVAGLTVHRDRLDPAMALLAEVVRRPAFPADQVDRLRDQQLADILQRRKEPRALASDAAARFIFRDDVPYARPLTGLEADVRALGSDQLAAFHEARFRAGSAAVVLAGAVEADRARALADEHFGDWRGEKAPAPAFDVAPRVDGPAVFLVDRPGSVQSEIRLGHVGVDRHHPDYFALLVMNTILGGAFTSRLNMNLRERHGFTYGARSGFSFRKRPGPFSIDAAVASDVTARAIEEALKEVRGLREEGPTDAELASARDYLRGVLPLRLQTTDQVAARIGEIFTFDLPSDYFETYRDRIAAVDAGDVQRVAREAVRPDRLAVVVVGDASAIEEPIRALDLGPLEVHEAIP